MRLLIYWGCFSNTVEAVSWPSEDYVSFVPLVGGKRQYGLLISVTDEAIYTIKIFLQYIIVVIESQTQLLDFNT